MNERAANKGIIAWCVNNPVAANLAMLAIIAAGFFGLQNVQRQVFPSFTSNTVSVKVPISAGALEEVEASIVQAIEAELAGVNGIEETRATATRSAGSVVATIKSGFDLDEVRTEIERVVSGIRFPEDAEQYTVSSATREGTVIVLTISSNSDERSLVEAAGTIKNELLELDNVSRITVSGIRSREIEISVDQDTLRRYGITIRDISVAIGDTSVNRGAGSLDGPGATLAFRISEDKRSAEDIAKIAIIRTTSGQIVELGQIAQVRDIYSGSPDVNRFDGDRSITMSILSGGVKNPADIVTQVRAYVEQKANTIDPDFSLTLWQDETVWLDARFGLVQDNLLSGLVLVLILLTLFLDLKLAFWVAVGIPVSFLGALALMPLDSINVSLNFISTFGFIIALGIVVDDAIVVGESVYTEVEMGLHKGKMAAIIGSQKVATATTFGVLTTMAGFGSLLFVDGFLGEAMGTMALVVILILAFSLIESKLILPSHLSHLKATKGNTTNLLVIIRNGVDAGLQFFIRLIYKPLLNLTLRFRLVTFVFFVAFAVMSAGLVVNGKVRMVFFPDIEGDTIAGSVQLKPGTPETSLILVADALEAALENTNQNMSIALSETTVEHFSLSARSSTVLSFTITLKPDVAREFTNVEFANAFSAAIPALPMIESVSVRSGPRGGSDVNVRLIGRQNEMLQNATIAVMAELNTIAGVSEIESDILRLQPEVVFSLTEEGRALGLTNAEVTSQIRSALSGQDVYQFLRDGEDVKVVVRLSQDGSDISGFLAKLLIEVSPNVLVPASQLVHLEYHPTVTQIVRRDGQRVSDVTANVDKALVSSSRVVAQLRESLAEIMLDYPGVEVTFSGEQRNQQSAISSMMLGATFALFTIYALLAIPLKSYVQPFVIFAVVPFSFVGVLWGHYFMGAALSLPSFLGIIALMGVVINDSLVLITTMNRMVEEDGISPEEAIVIAGSSRFRPVLLTSLTTFMGLVPLLLETSAQAAFIIPMGISLGFGILFATVFTLFLVPLLVSVSEDTTRIAKRIPKLFVSPIVP
ncbi:MAG: efflux RND transporter permease subunit [Rhodobacteraceae bacterium]|nr:efflux RND transporter permease subunit [Paracoccaceae bacterium]